MEKQYRKSVSHLRFGFLYQNYFLEHCSYLHNGIEKVYGRVIVTNYKLRFESSEDSTSGKVSFDIFLHENLYN